jgi:hypothetical protein
MATYAKSLLSGSVSGKAIAISVTASPGVVIHTGVVSSAAWDEVYIYASNSLTADVTLTAEVGATTIYDKLIQTIPFKSGLIPLWPGIPINGGFSISAYASSVSAVSIFGYVNKIT